MGKSSSSSRRRRSDSSGGVGNVGRKSHAAPSAASRGGKHSHQHNKSQGQRQRPKPSQQPVGGVAQERRFDRASQSKKNALKEKSTLAKRSRASTEEQQSQEEEDDELSIGGEDEFSGKSTSRKRPTQENKARDEDGDDDVDTDMDDDDDDDDDLFDEEDDEFGVAANRTGPPAPRDEFGPRFVVALEKTLSTRIQGASEEASALMCPILANCTESAKQIREEQLRRKESLRLRLEKKLLMEKDHARALMTKREKELKETALAGVLQLFNAVAKHQRELSEMRELEKKEKKDKVETMSQNKFLELLRKQVGQQGDSVEDSSSQDTTNEEKTDQTDDGDNGESSTGGGKWKVLQDNYLMGSTTMKDWDRASDSE